MTVDRRPHPCPYCLCTRFDDMGRVDRDAPFYPLVQAVMDSTNALHLETPGAHPTLKEAR